MNDYSYLDSIENFKNKNPYPRYMYDDDAIYLICNNKIDVIRYIIETHSCSSVGFNDCQPMGNIILNNAIRMKNLYLVKYLLDLGVYVHFNNCECLRYLENITNKKLIKEIITILLSKNINIHAENDRLLILSIVDRNIALLTYLLQNFEFNTHNPHLYKGVVPYIYNKNMFDILFTYLDKQFVYNVLYENVYGLSSLRKSTIKHFLNNGVRFKNKSIEKYLCKDKFNIIKNYHIDLFSTCMKTGVIV